MTKLGTFELRRMDDGWTTWDVYHDDEKVMTVNADVARGIMLREYDPDALARGELVPGNPGSQGENGDANRG